MAPRRGYKQCPECENDVGVRTKTCACGLVFVSKAKQRAKAKGLTVNPECPRPFKTGAPPPFKPKAQVGPPAFKPKAAIHEAPEFQVVRLTDRTTVQRFIADLKEALKSSINTGGCHSAFVHEKFGPSKTLQIEVHVK